ncbi:MAG: hypothetical protein methR_P0094 [Methyloprofundus sp.]|nr:MAG: hypothetical protein methR_P0094 [Methyloprofundus sp.]
MLTKKQVIYSALALTTGLSLSAQAQEALIFTIEAPLIQESQVDTNLYTLTTQDFESVPLWNKVFRNTSPYKTSFIWDGVGTYEGDSGTGKIRTDIVWGAAYGEGKYLFIFNTEGQSAEDNPGITLTFNEPVGYFGFWWSAGDYANKLTVTLADGTEIYVETGLIYQSEGYDNRIASEGGHMGSPTTKYLDENNGEPYAYLNLFATDENRKIAKVRFHGRNFETDNHTVTTAIISEPPGIEVPLPPTTPSFGYDGRFNIQEINKVKSASGIENPN